MAVSAPSTPAPKDSAGTLTSRSVHLAGILILVGAVPLAIYLPMGPKLIWSVVIAAVPLGFTVAGYYAWRRACPLAFFATLGQRFKRQRKQKVGEWLAAHGLEVQMGLLVTALIWRHLAANATPWALAGLLVAVILAATAVGFLYTGKTWCNHLCPVGVVEKIYQEPVLLVAQEGNSQCATCTACKKNCPDIDLEQAYWKEVQTPARRRVYYAWPGVVLAFYCYFYLAEGNWTHYFSGAWSRDPLVATRMFAPGFFFLPTIPRLAAVPLTFLVFGLASFVLFAALERLLLSKSVDEQDQALWRHRSLSLAGFSGFILFYAFAGQPALADLPVWVRQTLSVAIVMVATALLLSRWNRQEATFVQEKFAKGLLKRWEWGDAPPSDRLSDLYLLHQERVQQREARLKAYKATVRDLLAEGVLNRGNLLVLQKLRAELGIADKDHDKLLSELSLEDKRLFDPDYQGSLEKELQLHQYRSELESLLLGGRTPEPGVINSLRQVHRIQPEEHTRILDELRGENGPVVARLQQAVQATMVLQQAILAADLVTPGENGQSRGRHAFFQHVARWRQRRQLEHILQLLDAGQSEPGLQELRRTLEVSGSEGIRDVMQLLGAMADQGALGATLSPFTFGAAVVDHPGPVLREAARDESRYLRASGLTLLALLEDEASDTSLRQALLDPDPLVRETAQALLGVSHDLNQTLTDLAEDDEQWLLRAAVQSLPTNGNDKLGKPSHAVRPANQPPQTDGASLVSWSLFETIIHLHGVPLFAQLEPDDLEVLAKATRFRTFRPNEHLCHQGDRSDEVFLILKGRIRAWVLDEGGQPRSLGDSTEGACIGEMAVLDPAPRAATVTTLTEVTTLILDGGSFRDVLHDHPAVAEGVLRVMTQRLRSVIQGSRST